MAYLNCTRCRLSIEQHHGRPTLQDCPRCLARLGERIPMFRSPLRLAVLDGAIEDERHARRHGSTDPLTGSAR